MLNERLVHINHAFRLVRDCLDVIGNSACKVFTVIVLRDAYHTLRLAKESQKYCGITHIMVHQPTTTYEWEWACPVHLVFGDNLLILFDRNY